VSPAVPAHTHIHSFKSHITTALTAGQSSQGTLAVLHYSLHQRAASKLNSQCHSGHGRRHFLCPIRQLG
jgi:hypothetical protein